MSKKLYFLISFVLVLSLGGLAQADAIDVNNFSFELGSDGNQLTCGTGIDGVLTWKQGGGGFVGTNIDCCSPAIDASCLAAEDCWDVNTRVPGGLMPDGYAHLYFQVGAYVYQILDMNNSDANAVIEAGRKYTLEWDGLGWDDSITATLFYGSRPDANEIVSTTQSLVQSGETPWDYFPGKLVFVAEPNQDYLGETLGLKFTPGGDGYVFIDNVRLEWSWISSAYNPDPADEAEDVPMDVNLAWSPGLWAVGDANGHEVYFGTSWAEVDSATTATTGIYRGTGVGVVSGPDVNNRYSYDVLETLELGRPYYWRIDEVNENWVSGPVPPVNDRWKGDVWGFRTIGYAYNVYPADGAEEIPVLNLTLYWEAGGSAGSHDVYLGSDEADVEDANTANTGLYPGVYRGPMQPLSDVNYLAPEALEVGIDYFWRIDEVNTGTGTLVTGDVWSFTTGTFLIVDSFEPHRYADTADLRDTWKDWFATGGLNDALVQLYFVKTDSNKVIDEQSMEFAYRCYKKDGPAWVGSYAYANTADLEIGTDWTAAGVKALVVNYYGDEENAYDHNSGQEYDITEDQMYVALEDVSTNVGILKLPNMSSVKEESWHTWNISLEDPCFSSVDMNNVTKVYIGFGGEKGGQGKAGAGQKSGKHDTVWFDDIRLYPPRCMPEVTGLDVIHALGDFTGPDETEDCNTDYFDLEMMAADWMKIDGDVSTKNSPGIMTGWVGEPNWTGGHIGGALEVNDVEGGHKIDVTDPRLPGLTNMTITAWVKRNGGPFEYCGIVASREEGGGATELMGDGGKDNQASYGWNGDYWGYKTGLVIPDMTWTFIAVAVEPTQATVYMHPDPCAPTNGVMSSSTNVDDHGTLEHFYTQFRIGRSNPDGKRFKGWLDDIRIYGWTLTEANMEQLVHETGEPGEPNDLPIYWYKFDDGAGLVAADSGYGTQIYQVNILPTNLVPKDPCESEDPNLGSGALDPNNLDIINFRDYRKMAENWLMGPWLWPAVP